MSAPSILSRAVAASAAAWLCFGCVPKRVDEQQPEEEVDGGETNGTDHDGGPGDGGVPARDGGPDGGPLDAGRQDAGSPTRDAGPCQAYVGPVELGRIAHPALVELSGLAASRAHPGVLYGHNDSGDTARFFALAETGAHLGEFTLPQVTARDWEDVAVGPCPQGSCVFIGDIGDNRTVRTDYVVYRVAEPALSADAGTAAVSFDALPFTYPAGAKYNAETLLVHPSSGDIYIATKHAAGTASAVFRFPRPHRPGTSVELEKVADLPIPLSVDLPLTAGDIHPSGGSVLFRTYSKVYELRKPVDGGFEAAFQAVPTSVPAATEPQGEAVTWLLDGGGYLTSSEGVSQPIQGVRCTP